MTVSVVAGEHQKRDNTSTQQVLVFGVRDTARNTGWEKIGVGKRKGAVLGIFTLSNQFNQMDPH